jgi:protein-disulfide isomerase
MTVTRSLARHAARPRARAHRALAFVVTAALLLVGTASAQIGQDPARFVELVGGVVEGDALILSQGVRLELVERGGLLYRVRGEASLDDDGVAGVAATVAAATGFGDAIEGPVAEFLVERASDLAGAGAVVIGVERYRLTLDVRGDAPFELSFAVALAEVPEEAFPVARHAIGPDDAEIVVREFSDFSCPFCRRYVLEVLPRLAAELFPRGDVRFEYHHFPLRSLFPHSDRAAAASECAADAAPDDAAAFWRYHDALFEHQAAWSRAGDPDAIFLDLADEAGVDRAAVASCLAEGVHRATVDAAHAAAAALQLRGTPSVFVNGFPLEDFTRIEAYLELAALSRAFGSGER